MICDASKEKQMQQAAADSERERQQRQQKRQQKQSRKQRRAKKNAAAGNDIAHEVDVRGAAEFITSEVEIINSRKRQRIEVQEHINTSYAYNPPQKDDYELVDADALISSLRCPNPHSPALEPTPERIAGESLDDFKNRAFKYHFPTLGAVPPYVKGAPGNWVLGLTKAQERAKQFKKDHPMINDVPDYLFQVDYERLTKQHRV